MNTHGGGPPSGAQIGVNLAYTTFLFVTPSRDDESTRALVRAAGGVVARGFSNDFDAQGRDAAPHETVQFLVGTGRSAPYAIQVSSKYRPRLKETEVELRRRVGDIAAVTALEGAVRMPQYTSAAMHAYVNTGAIGRASGRTQPNAIVIPMRKSKEWWDKPALDRQIYFYPHGDVLGSRVKGHARAAEAGIGTVFRKLYHNPDGYGRENEWDFVTYFECADDHLATFDEVCRALRDLHENPEWRYVTEGPEWRGRRVLRW
jgi:hypothetical protein